MQFKNETNLSEYDFKLVEQKLTPVLLELCARKDNKHIGTGLGGNENQALAAICFPHVIVESDRDYVAAFRFNQFVWNATQVNKLNKKDIRLSLNDLFKEIEPLVEKIKNYIDNNVSLEEFGSEAVDNFNKYQSAVSALISLNEKLDNNNYIDHDVEAVGSFLHSLPETIVLLAVRQYVTIDRMVKHDLDSYTVFGDCINKITKLVS